MSGTGSDPVAAPDEKPEPLERPIGSASPGADPDHPSGTHPPAVEETEQPTDPDRAARNLEDESPV